MRRNFTRTVLLLVVVLSWVGTLGAEDKARAIDALLTRYHALGVFNGTALVADNGKVILKKGFGLADFEWKIPNTPDTKFRLGSITKQFTATLVMQMVDEGKLSLDSTLASAIPYYRKDTGSQVTIHHLLTHTSGIPSYTGSPDFSEIRRDPYGVREFVEKFCSGDLEFDPGAKFRYNNSGYFILGAIIEQVDGKPYEQVLRERIFEPLGMKASGYDRSAPILEKRARGYEPGLAGVKNTDYLDMSLPYSAGSLYSTVEDLYVWDQALYGEKVLPSRAKELMFTIHATSDTPQIGDYGYGWVIRKRSIGPGNAERVTIGHGGSINGFNTLITRVPEDRHLVVLLNNTGGTTLGAMSDGIADILYGRTPEPPKRPIASVMYETIRTDGVAAAISQYREIKETRAAEFDLGVVQLDRLGKELLGQKQTADAIEIFKLNVEAFPERAYPYNSLASAYMEAGDKEQAIKSFAKVLELNPLNRNAVEKLNELIKR